MPSPAPSSSWISACRDRTSQRGPMATSLHLGWLYVFTPLRKFPWSPQAKLIALLPSYAFKIGPSSVLPV